MSVCTDKLQEVSWYRHTLEYWGFSSRPLQQNTYRNKAGKSFFTGGGGGGQGVGECLDFNL